MLAPWKKSYDKPRQHIKKQRQDITLPTKIYIVRVMVFPVVMYGCENWTIRRLSTKELMLLKYGVEENSWESLGQQGDQQVNPKGNWPWIVIGRTDVEVEAPRLGPPNVKRQLIGKDPDAGKDWRQEKKGTTEDEMLGWHYQLIGHEFEQTPGDSEGQGSLVFYSPWTCKESDTT